VGRRFTCFALILVGWVAADPALEATAATLPAPVACESCWVPPVTTSRQLQLQGTVNQSVNARLYVVSSLHQAGRRVICYIDAGTLDPWRPDARQVPATVIGNSVAGFSNE